MLQSLREDKEGKLQMLSSLRRNGLDSLSKKVRVLKTSMEAPECTTLLQLGRPRTLGCSPPGPWNLGNS